MSPESNDNQPPRRPLISVERQVETDIATGKTETRMFVKMYFEVRDSGLLALMPAELWQTLCCLATYMDEHGICYPGQARMARELGISRQQLNSRLQRLLAFRFQERAVITVTKRRTATSGGGRFGHNLYRIQPIAGFGIFGYLPAPTFAAKPVSSRLDMGPVSGLPDAGAPESGALDRNQNYKENKNTPRVDSQKEEPLGDRLAGELVARFHALRKHAPRKATPKEVSQAKTLVGELGQPRAHFVLEYAINEARRTQFEMRHFGAILQYLDEALGRYEREQARLTEAAESRREAEEEERRIAYDRWRAQEVERVKQSMAPDELAALTGRVRERLAERLGSDRSIGFESFVDREVNTLVAEANDLPSYEVWRAREYPWLRRMSEASPSSGREDQ